MSNRKLKDKLYKEKYPYKSIMDKIRKRSRIKNIPCNLNMAWAKSTYTGYCSISGLKFIREGGLVTPFHPSLDRIKPELGYVQDNCRWILFGLNALKGAYTDADVFIICKAICDYNVNK